jgi:hypothetical protein
MGRGIAAVTAVSGTCVSRTAASKVVHDSKRNHSFLSGFPMFVPSLSW